MHRRLSVSGGVSTSLIILAVIIVLGVVTPATAQIDQGSITGVIKDQTGSAISGASVTLVSQETGLSFSRTTGSSGYYTFSPIKIGAYTLTVSAPSFESLKQE